MTSDPAPPIDLLAPRSSPSAPVRMPGRAQGPGAVLAVLAVLLAGALACGCGQSAAAEGHTDRSLRSGPTLPGPDPPPTRA
ncbi:MAG: hypothetical protein ABSF33_17280, partial [Acidimicrobiales bacterium]